MAATLAAKTSAETRAVAPSAPATSAAPRAIATKNAYWCSTPRSRGRRRALASHSGSWRSTVRRYQPPATVHARTAWCRPVRFAFSFLPRVFRVADLEPEQGVEQQMKSFRQLGVADAVVRALALRGIETPFAIQSLVIPDGLNG